MESIKTFFKKNYIYFLIIIGIAIVFTAPYVVPNVSHHGGDWRLVHQSTNVIIDQTFDEGIPLWTPFLAGGTPFYAVPDKPLSYPPMYLMSMFFNPYNTLNFSIVLHTILGGIFIYLFMDYLIKNKKASTISTIFYMFIFQFIPPAWQFSITWTPLVFLFGTFALRSKKYITYSILSALFLSLMFHSGGVFQFFISFLFLGLYLGVWIFQNGFKLDLNLTRLIKTVKIMFIISIFFFGFIAVRFLPFNEWSDSTSRSDKLPFEITKKGALNGPEFFKHVIDGARGKAQIGYFGIFLVILSLFYLKKERNRTQLNFTILSLLMLLILFAVFHKFLYSFVPGFSMQRGLIRNAFMLTFCFSILCGFGYLYLEKLIPKKYLKGMFVLAIVLITFDLVLFSNIYPDLEPYDVVIKDNEMIKYISEQDGVFRIHSNEIRGIDYNDIQMLTIPNKIEMLYGHYGGIWIPEYLNEMLGVSMQSPSKIWGVYNVKYLTSNEEINKSGFKFVKKFKEDENTPIDYMDGPYLYENENFVPRTVQYKHSVLVLGTEDSVKQAAYWVLLNEQFNTSTTVVVSGKEEKVNNYNFDFLSKFDAIILTQGSVDGSSSTILKSYSNEGRLFPNILEGEQSLDQDSLGVFLSELNEKYETLEIINKRNNELSFNSNDFEGFVFVGEKYNLFPGWNLDVDGKSTDYYRCNGGMVCIPNDDDGLYEFNYLPKSLVVGLIITLLTILLGVVLIYREWK